MLVANENQQVAAGGALKDIAPTVLGILGVSKPEQMAGNDLRRPG
jgi:bisphosphoglycerate-independent phosphoglycerate mutase (AlkP superfamily)